MIPRYCMNPVAISEMLAPVTRSTSSMTVIHRGKREYTRPSLHPGKRVMDDLLLK